MNQPKDKRGKLFTVIESGENVKLNRIQSDGRYFVDFENGSYDSFDRSDLSEQKQNKVSSISNKPKKLTEVQQTDKNALNIFFDTLAMPQRCQECGDMLMAFNKFAKRSCCCHILPKFKFESIATNELNILYMGADFLGGCSDHDFWDRSVSNRKRMNVYILALQRYELLKEFLTDAEIVSADKYLGL
jgi:hypothetical protein